MTLADHVAHIEGGLWRHPGAKDAAITERTGLSITAYYVAVRRLLDEPAFEAEHPTLVRRLRRLHEARRALRTRTT